MWILEDLVLHNIFSCWITRFWYWLTRFWHLIPCFRCWITLFGAGSHFFLLGKTYLDTMYICFVLKNSFSVLDYYFSTGLWIKACALHNMISCWITSLLFSEQITYFRLVTHFWQWKTRFRQRITCLQCRRSLLIWITCFWHWMIYFSIFGAGLGYNEVLDTLKQSYEGINKQCWDN